MFLVDGPGFRRRLAVSAAHCHVSDNNISSGWKEPKKYHETVDAGRSLEPTLTRINPHADRLLAVLGYHPRSSLLHPAMVRNSTFGAAFSRTLYPPSLVLLPNILDRATSLLFLHRQFKRLCKKNTEESIKDY